MHSIKASGKAKDLHKLLTYEPELIWDKVSNSDRLRLKEKPFPIFLK